MTCTFSLDELRLCLSQLFLALLLDRDRLLSEITVVFLTTTYFCPPNFVFDRNFYVLGVFK